MDLSIIIVSWNCREQLRANLNSLNKSTGLNFEIFVVDNASSDGTVAMLQAEFPQINLIANDQNFGFAKANNQALRLAQGNFILLLNPDMLLESHSLVDAVTWLKANPQASVTGFKLIKPDGTVIRQVRSFPKLIDQLLIVLKLPKLMPALLDNYIRADFDYDQASAVDSIRGSFFLMRRQVLETVGYLDERFFLWFEEVDYCQRVWRAGQQVWYSPAVTVVDGVGQSFKLLKRGQAQGYFRDSMLKYFAKWRPADEKHILQVAWWLVGLALRFVKK